MANRVNNTLKLEGVRLIFCNFSGERDKFGKTDRNFCVLLSADEAERLQAEGWKIRWLNPRDEEDEPRGVLNVTVSYRNVAPRIVKITSFGKVDITEDSVGSLDRDDIRSADLIINPYNWEVNGNSGVKAYLKTAYITLEEDDFAHKYYGNGYEEAPF